MGSVTVMARGFGVEGCWRGHQGITRFRSHGSQGNNNAVVLRAWGGLAAQAVEPAAKSLACPACWSRWRDARSNRDNQDP